MSGSESERDEESLKEQVLAPEPTAPGPSPPALNLLDIHEEIEEADLDSPGQLSLTGFSPGESSNRSPSFFVQKYQKVFGSTWNIPKTVRFDFDFYKVLFLNMKNDDYNVSTIQMLVTYEKFASVLGIKLSKECARVLAGLQNEGKIVTWDAYLGQIKEFERNARLSGPKRVDPHDSFAELHIARQLSMVLSQPERVYMSIEDSATSNWATVIGFIRFSMIFLSVISIILESMPYFKVPPNCGQSVCFGEPVALPAFKTIEIITTVMFTLDFAIRFGLIGFVRSELTDRARIVEMSVGRKSPYVPRTFWTRIFVFLFSLQAVIDIVSFLPFYIRLALTDSRPSAGLQVFRVIRFGSILRLARLKQFKDVSIILKHAFSNSLAALGILFLAFLIMILFFSVLCYFQEAGEWHPVGSLVNGSRIAKGAFYRPTAQDPNLLELSQFTSIPASLWWAIITAVTVGYGDMYPASSAGKFVGACLAMCGVVVLAMPIAVIGSNFTKEYDRFYGIRAQVALSKEKDIQSEVIKKYLYDEQEAAGFSRAEKPTDSHRPAIDTPAKYELKLLCENRDNLKPVSERFEALTSTSELRAQDIADFVKSVIVMPDLGAQRVEVQTAVLRAAIDLIKDI